VLCIAQTAIAYIAMRIAIMGVLIVGTNFLTPLLAGERENWRIKMKRMILMILLTLLSLTTIHLYTLQSNLIIPIRIVEKQTIVSAQLQYLGIRSHQIVKAVEVVERQTGLSSEFLIALMHTESTGNPRAVSSKGYRGLMQIPHAVYYEDANMLIGAYIFKEKLKQAKGNIVNALMLYKGYNLSSQRGLQQAHKVLALRDRLRKVKVG
jgi:hypothetical protein